MERWTGQKWSLVLWRRFSQFAYLHIHFFPTPRCPCLLGWIMLGRLTSDAPGVDPSIPSVFSATATCRSWCSRLAGVNDEARRFFFCFFGSRFWVLPQSKGERVCACVCTCACEYLHVCMCVCVCVCLCACVGAWMAVRMDVCVCISVRVFVYICTYTNWTWPNHKSHTHTHTFEHTRGSQFPYG